MIIRLLFVYTFICIQYGIKNCIICVFKSGFIICLAKSKTRNIYIHSQCNKSFSSINIFRYRNRSKCKLLLMSN